VNFKPIIPAVRVIAWPSFYVGGIFPLPPRICPGAAIWKRAIVVPICDGGRVGAFYRILNGYEGRQPAQKAALRQIIATYVARSHILFDPPPPRRHGCFVYNGTLNFSLF
jgi:hypothetical protein